MNLLTIMIRYELISLDELCQKFLNCINMHSDGLLDDEVGRP